MNGVGDDALELGMMIRGIRLVAGAERENPALSTRVAASAAENLASAKPAYQDQRVGLRNIEIFAIHLLVLQLDVFPETRRDRMAGLYHPEALMIVALAPLQLAGSAQQALENLREVPGVQYNQPHACQDALLHAFHHLIGLRGA